MQFLAFNFGFVRVPDWMDTWVISLVIISAICAGMTQLFKPSGVPFNQLYRTKLTGYANVAFRSTQISFAVLMVLLFTGMGLARMS